jgi:arginine decarboxylase
VPLTPLPPKGLDYLSSPSGCIAAAQEAAAAAFGAARTFFLVNGCTVGIHAAVMATCPPGATLLLARNCHLSAFNAAVLAGCRVAWVDPETDAAHGVAHCVAPGALAGALSAAAARGEAVGAVLVVSPTYFGAAARLAGARRGCGACARLRRPHAQLREGKCVWPRGGPLWLL